jgi:hypothetical protein
MSKKRARKPPRETPSVIGWRCWFISPFGGLMSPALATQSGWTSAEITATCPNGEELTGPHTPPGKDCTCGLRIFDTFETAIDVIRTDPQKSNCTPSFWWNMSLQNDLPELWGYRQRFDALSIPDVIGTVYGYGHTEPGKKLGDIPGLAPEQYVDPPGTLRVERARVGDRLYLAPHMMQTAAMHEIGYKAKSVVASLKRLYPKSKVHIGVNYGPEWLDEIAEAEDLNTEMEGQTA